MTDQELRDKIRKITSLAERLFEQQFIRHGGRKEGDPSWDGLEEVERDEWWDRALDAAPLLAAERAERDLLLWLHAEAVWLAGETEAALLRALAGASGRVHELVDEKHQALKECARLRREVEFEANGAGTFAGANEVADRAAGWAQPVPECSAQYHAHGPHDVLLPELKAVPCPGLGPLSRPVCAVHPGGTE